MKISYLKKCKRLCDINVRIAQLYAMDILIAKVFYTYIDDTIKIIKISYDDCPSMETAPSFKYYRSGLLSLFISDWVRLNKTVRYSDIVVDPCLYDIKLGGSYFYLISPKNGDRIYYRHGRDIYE